MPRRVLLVARTYPPIVGGMEQYAHDLHKHLAAVTDVTLLANPAGKRGLPLFMLKAAGYLFVNARKFTHIHFADGVLAPLMRMIKPLTRAQLSITVHGLDILYQKYGYQSVVPRCVKSAHRVVCVSQHTRDQCVQRGIDALRCVVIPNGIDFLTWPVEPPCSELVTRHTNQKVLLTVGRLVQRKGHAWFIRHVMTQLSDDYVYLIAGDGPQRPQIEQAIEQAGLSRRVILLGRISDADKHSLLAHSHLFIMPNGPVAGDAEGFGIALIEAGAHGLAVVASRLEGISDAVIEGQTGQLVSPRDAAGFVAAITGLAGVGLSLTRDQVRQATRDHFDWRELVKQYIDTVFD